MKDKLTHIETKISQLKQKKERIQTHQALLLMREAQKIFQGEFSSDVALKVLKDHWNGASEAQKEEWKKRAGPFLGSPHKTRKTTENRNPAAQQSRKAEAPHHEHPGN
ncbi:MAG: hypothetical protein JNJ47_07295 [Alphaproteobacteria bacterium]|nr:hypothetical protein [Alphaproteobacteria bacterium]